MENHDEEDPQTKPRKRESTSSSFSGLPSLIISVMAIVFGLYAGKDILVPFVVALFFVYLIRPLVNFLTLPFSSCLRPCCSLQPPRHRRSGSEGGGRRASDTPLELDGEFDEFDAHHDTFDPHHDKFHRGRTGDVDTLLLRSNDFDGTISSNVSDRDQDCDDHHDNDDHDHARDHLLRDSRGGSSSSGGAGNVAERVEAENVIGAGVATGAGVAAIGIQTAANAVSSVVSALSSPARKFGASRSDKRRRRERKGTTTRDTDRGSWSRGGGKRRGRGREMKKCRCTRCPRSVAVVLALAFAASLVAVLILMVVDAVQTFEKRNLKAYEREGARLINHSVAFAKTVLKVDSSFLVAQLTNEFPISSMLRQFVMWLVAALSDLFWIMLFILYLLFEKVREPRPRHGVDLRTKIDEQIQRYIGLKTFISAIAGLAVYIVLGPMLRVQMASLFGVLSFVLNFIPNVGPLVATLLPLPILILDPELSLLTSILGLALPTVIHAIVGNVLEPKLFGNSLELHPITVLLSLAFWFALWGVPGAILSVPITAVFRIILTHVKHPYAKVILAMLEGHMQTAFGSSSFV